MKKYSKPYINYIVFELSPKLENEKQLSCLAKDFNEMFAAPYYTLYEQNDSICIKISLVEIVPTTVRYPEKKIKKKIQVSKSPWKKKFL